MVRKITFNRAPEASPELKNVDVVLLCGGLGTRLKTVLKDKPKALADVGGAPFLDILIDSLLSHGFRRIILAVGHLKQHLVDHYSGKLFEEHGPYVIEFSNEESPLGTGGAVKKAANLVLSDQFLVMNGDCFCKVNFHKFYKEHKNKNAMLSIALADMDDISDYGSVQLDEQGRIGAFNEKSVKKTGGLVSAGAYFMNKAILEHMPAKEAFSLEHDLFPFVLDKQCHGFVAEGGVLDIGVPERYEKAVRLFSGAKD